MKNNNFFNRIVKWIKGFRKTKKKFTPTTERKVIPSPVPQKSMGKGRNFSNNRKRTNGRKIQVIQMGKISRVIYHESF